MRIRSDAPSGSTFEWYRPAKTGRFHWIVDTNATRTRRHVMRVQDNGNSITLWASANDTWAWANRSGSAWPCSTLADHRFCASFDDNGLVDLTVDGREAGDIDGHELSAICADLLSARITSDHPCWNVTVGQFN